MDSEEEKNDLQTKNTSSQKEEDSSTGSYNKVWHHVATLFHVQDANVALTQEIQFLDQHPEKRPVPQRLWVGSNPPRLLKFLHCSEDFLSLRTQPSFRWVGGFAEFGMRSYHTRPKGRDDVSWKSNKGLIPAQSQLHKEKGLKNCGKTTSVIGEETGRRLQHWNTCIDTEKGAKTNVF